MNNYPDKGTDEYHVFMLKKVQRWLDFMLASPKPGKNIGLIEDEAAAVSWALKEIAGKNNG